MSRLPLDSFDRMGRDMAARMERMRRQRARFTAFVATLAFTIVCFAVGAAVWLLLHPEAIGAFFGRILAGAESAS